MFNLSCQQTIYYIRSYDRNCRVYELQIVCLKRALIAENSERFQERHLLNTTTFFPCKYNFFGKKISLNQQCSIICLKEVNAFFFDLNTIRNRHWFMGTENLFLCTLIISYRRFFAVFYPHQIF